MPSDCRGFRSRLTAAGAAAAVLVGLAGPAALAHNAGWPSGARNNDATTGFAGWRGTGLGVVSGWIDWKNGWSGMYSYASGTQPRALRAKNANVSFGHGLFPQGSTLSACAAGSYDDEQKEVARRLATNGAGDAEIRLGWEANGDWFPWSASSSTATTWKTCFTRVANAMKSAAPNLRIAWSMGKKGRIDVRTIWPDGAPITNVCLSHYDDAYDRFGTETYLGGPWGLQAWIDFAKSKGKKFCLGEWGVGRDGDNPSYIQSMHDVLERNAAAIAHEAYFNTSEYQLYPSTRVPKSAALYRELF
jgi:hypothetical protein